jgi:hypothetical protein
VHGPTRHNVSAVLPCQCDTTKSRACCVWVQPVRLAYQPPASSSFLSQ